MKYPSIIHFEPTDDGIRVKYKKDVPKGRVPKYNLDIWAISYLLNKGLYRDDKVNVVYLDIIDVTTALRLHFLSEAALFKNIQFNVCQSDAITDRVEDILNDAGKAEKYVTYDKDKGPDFSKRGTKRTAESLLERSICDNIATVFGDEFPATAVAIRQFPANIFEGEISKARRVRGTRKFWIDILTVNKFNQLSAVELKAGANAPLDLLMQAVDYGIVCHLFKNHYAECWFPEIGQVNQNKMAIYCVAQEFHPAITGAPDYRGVTSVIRRNGFFDIILIQIAVENNKVRRMPKTLFDTRE